GLEHNVKVGLDRPSQTVFNSIGDDRNLSSTEIDFDRAGAKESTDRQQPRERTFPPTASDDDADDYADAPTERSGSVSPDPASTFYGLAPSLFRPQNHHYSWSSAPHHRERPVDSSQKRERSASAEMNLGSQLPGTEETGPRPSAGSAPASASAPTRHHAPSQNPAMNPSILSREDDVASSSRASQQHQYQPTKDSSYSMTSPTKHYRYADETLAEPGSAAATDATTAGSTKHSLVPIEELVPEKRSSGWKRDQEPSTSDYETPSRSSFVAREAHQEESTPAAHRPVVTHPSAMPPASSTAPAHHPAPEFKSLRTNRIGTPPQQDSNEGNQHTVESRQRGDTVESDSGLASTHKTPESTHTHRGLGRSYDEPIRKLPVHPELSHSQTGDDGPSAASFPSSVHYTPEPSETLPRMPGQFHDYAQPQSGPEGSSATSYIPALSSNAPTKRGGSPKRSGPSWRYLTGPGRQGKPSKRQRKATKKHDADSRQSVFDSISSALVGRKKNSVSTPEMHLDEVFSDQSGLSRPEDEDEEDSHGASTVVPAAAVAVATGLGEGIRSIWESIHMPVIKTRRASEPSTIKDDSGKLGSMFSHAGDLAGQKMHEHAPSKAATLKAPKIDLTLFPEEQPDYLHEDLDQHENPAHPENVMDVVEIPYQNLEQSSATGLSGPSAQAPRGTNAATLKAPKIDLTLFPEEQPDYLHEDLDQHENPPRPENVMDIVEIPYQNLGQRSVTGLSGPSTATQAPRGTNAATLKAPKIDLTLFPEEQPDYLHENRIEHENPPRPQNVMDIVEIPYQNLEQQRSATGLSGPSTVTQAPRGTNAATLKAPKIDLTLFPEEQPDYLHEDLDQHENPARPENVMDIVEIPYQQLEQHPTTNLPETSARTQAPRGVIAPTVLDLHNHQHESPMMQSRAEHLSSSMPNTLLQRGHSTAAALKRPKINLFLYPEEQPDYPRGGDTHDSPDRRIQLDNYPVRIKEMYYESEHPYPHHDLHPTIVESAAAAVGHGLESIRSLLEGIHVPTHEGEDTTATPAPTMESEHGKRGMPTRSVEIRSFNVPVTYSVSTHPYGMRVPTTTESHPQDRSVHPETMKAPHASPPVVPVYVDSAHRVSPPHPIGTGNLLPMEEKLLEAKKFVPGEHHRRGMIIHSTAEEDFMDGSHHPDSSTMPNRARCKSNPSIIIARKSEPLSVLPQTDNPFKAVTITTAPGHALRHSSDLSAPTTGIDTTSPWSGSPYQPQQQQPQQQPKEPKIPIAQPPASWVASSSTPAKAPIGQMPSMQTTSPFTGVPGVMAAPSAPTMSLHDSFPATEPTAAHGVAALMAAQAMTEKPEDVLIMESESHPTVEPHSIHPYELPEQQQQDQPPQQQQRQLPEQQQQQYELSQKQQQQYELSQKQQQLHQLLGQQQHQLPEQQQHQLPEQQQQDQLPQQQQHQHAATHQDIEHQHTLRNVALPTATETLASAASFDPVANANADRTYHQAPEPFRSELDMRDLDARREQERGRSTSMPENTGGMEPVRAQRMSPAQVYAAAHRPQWTVMEEDPSESYGDDDGGRAGESTLGGDLKQHGMNERTTETQAPVQPPRPEATTSSPATNDTPLATESIPHQHSLLHDQNYSQGVEPAAPVHDDQDSTPIARANPSLSLHPRIEDSLGTQPSSSAPLTREQNVPTGYEGSLPKAEDEERLMWFKHVRTDEERERERERERTGGAESGQDQDQDQDQEREPLYEQMTPTTSDSERRERDGSVWRRFTARLGHGHRAGRRPSI
ncbi:hypothetical protein BGZ54_002189, partial [Gamsiella multidivaricata]